MRGYRLTAPHSVHAGWTREPVSPVHISTVVLRACVAKQCSAVAHSAQPDTVGHQTAACCHAAGPRNQLPTSNDRHVPTSCSYQECVCRYQRQGPHTLGPTHSNAHPCATAAAPLPLPRRKSCLLRHHPGPHLTVCTNLLSCTHMTRWHESPDRAPANQASEAANISSWQCVSVLGLLRPTPRHP